MKIEHVEEVVAEAKNVQVEPEKLLRNRKRAGLRQLLSVIPS